MITNKITDRIIDKITNMTSKLQMLITFATVVCLRPTIYQNTQNSEENLDKGICSTIFFPKNTSKCLNFVFKDQTPTFFFQNFATFVFDTKCERHKKQEQERDKDKNKNETRTQITEHKTQTRTKQDVNKNANNRTRTKHEHGLITKKNNRI